MTRSVHGIVFSARFLSECNICGITATLFLKHHAHMEGSKLNGTTGSAVLLYRMSMSEGHNQ